MQQQVANTFALEEMARDELLGEPEGSVWQRVLASLVRDKAALFGALIVLAFVLVAIFAPLLAPFNPDTEFTNGLSVTGAPLAPNHHFVLGTDDLGRDLLSRLLYGARVSLIVGLLANGLAMIIGVTVGATAAYAGGWVATVLMRLTDIMMAFPVLLFAIALIAITSPSLTNIIIVIAILYWTTTARIIYGMVLSLKEREFVEAAHAIGASGFRTLFFYILPHLTSVIIVYTTLGVATTVLVEAALSFVGIGVQPPTPSWGNMINEAQSYYRADPWMMLFPGIAIVLTVLGFNLLGDWLRDTLDPVHSQLG
ncbi:MAG TPA: ABC transporter permease [Chloroflexota bacterium]|nr:ABC transporter permease [Chloroflexota bacterium]